MRFRFNWQSDASHSQQAAVETQLLEDIQSAHSPIHPCHSGSAEVNLSIEGALRQALVGNIKCSCGVPVGIVQGASDASHINLTSIGPRRGA